MECWKILSINALRCNCALADGRANIPGASSGASEYEKAEIERSKLRGIKPGRQRLMKVAIRHAYCQQMSARFGHK